MATRLRLLRMPLVNVVHESMLKCALLKDSVCYAVQPNALLECQECFFPHMAFSHSISDPTLIPRMLCPTWVQLQYLSKLFTTEKHIYSIPSRLPKKSGTRGKGVRPLLLKDYSTTVNYTR